MKVAHEALRALGLTDYGARAYAALVSLGPSEAAVVASAAPVPRTKIYAVLRELERRGWIDVESGRPRRYRARRPRDCFERERERQARVVEAGLPVLEEHFDDRATRFAGPLWMLEGERAVEERALRMLAAARADVLMVASFPFAADRREIPRALKDAMRRGARVRLAVASVAEMPDLARAVPEVRELRLPPRFLLVDGREALIAVPQARSDGTQDVRAVWNPSAELLSVMGLAVDRLWDMAQEPETAPEPPRSVRR